MSGSTRTPRPSCSAAWPARRTASRRGCSSTLLEAGAETLHGLAFHLSLLGWEFEVEEPPELREVLAGLGGRALRAAEAAAPTP